MFVFLLRFCCPDRTFGVTSNVSDLQFNSEHIPDCSQRFVGHKGSCTLGVFDPY